MSHNSSNFEKKRGLEGRSLSVCWLVYLEQWKLRHHTNLIEQPHISRVHWCKGPSPPRSQPTVRSHSLHHHPSGEFSPRNSSCDHTHVQTREIVEADLDPTGREQRSHEHQTKTSQNAENRGRVCLVRSSPCVFEGCKCRCSTSTGSSASISPSLSISIRTDLESFRYDSLTEQTHA